ncbi:hypothetical protein N44_00880 [Microcystis aeruginosa NIES-44]|uniref:Uncharacterized protein n=1 Tax=Microcystis aeruginosa NIES-44 TaxID=449439 RepID=A0A0A1VR90_MICAE|nr:hypothetical protein N44_00880 [Microcystis aeruginosa NIES-44]
MPILSDNCDSRRKVSQQLLRIKDLASQFYRQSDRNSPF